MFSLDHSSKRYDAELDGLRTRVLQMGGLVEAQIRAAVDAFEAGNLDEFGRVDLDDQRVNNYEVTIDADCAQIIARRQPMGNDLRMLMGISKIVTDLERCGDEGAKIARISQQIYARERLRIPRSLDIRELGELALHLLHEALDTFARLDADAASEIAAEDRQLDEKFQGITRQLITFMMEDPRTISTALDILFIAKAVERIGDHAKNVAEQVIYIVRGTDVRHVKAEQRMESGDTEAS